MQAVQSSAYFATPLISVYIPPSQHPTSSMTSDKYKWTKQLNITKLVASCYNSEHKVPVMGRYCRNLTHAIFFAPICKIISRSLCEAYILLNDEAWLVAPASPCASLLLLFIACASRLISCTVGGSTAHITVPLEFLIPEWLRPWNGWKLFGMMWRRWGRSYQRCLATNLYSWQLI